MKKLLPITIVAIIFFAAGVLVTSAFAKQKQEPGYIVEHEKDIAADQPGPHKGGGNSTAYNFFSNANDCKLVFRKRVLHPGSAIGYHLQMEDEIYYIIDGTGEMNMNGKTFEVSAGDAILTRPGNTHGLKQTGNNDLVVLINYEKKDK